MIVPYGPIDNVVLDLASVSRAQDFDYHSLLSA